MLNVKNNNRNIILLKVNFFFKLHYSNKEWLTFLQFYINKFKAIHLKDYNLLIKTNADIQFAVCNDVGGQIQMELDNL